MNRILPSFAVVNTTMLLGAFGLGLYSAAYPRAEVQAFHTLHFLFGLGASLTTLLVHSIVFTYFLGTGRWIKEVVQVYGMSDWAYRAAVKNKRRAFPFEFLSMALVGGTVWLGAAADTAEIDSLWHLGMAALTIGFNFGAYFVEFGAVTAQARLIAQVKEEADRMREERLAMSAAPESTTAAPAGSPQA